MSEEPIKRGPYYHRRPLRGTDLLPAIGVGIGVGLAAFYVARVLLEKTALFPLPAEMAASRRARLPARR